MAFGIIACVLPQGGAMVTTMDVSLSVLHSILPFLHEKQNRLKRVFLKNVLQIQKEWYCLL